MELEEAIKRLNKKLKSEKELKKISSCTEIVEDIILDNQAIETVLQELKKLQFKERSRIIGNINEIKIEDLEPVLKPYYIPKKKIEDKIAYLNDIKGDNTQSILNKIKVLQELLEDK